MKDLFDWQKSIASKEKRQPHATQSIPAPRGRASSGSVASAPEELQAPAIRPQAVAKKVPSSSSKKTEGVSAASHTYTGYSKWDRFDIDAALGSDDEAVAPTEKKTTPPSHTPAPLPLNSLAADPNTILTKDPLSSVSSEGADMTARSTSRSLIPPKKDEAVESHPLPPIRSQEPQTSDGWKARGNDLFKIGQWESAAECYTKSFDLFDLTSPSTSTLSSAAVVLSNRAMANLKLEKWSEAEADCSHALELDSNNAKAFHRRGVAHKNLKNIEAAAGDFESASRLEPPSLYHIFSHSTQLGPTVAPSSSLSERDSCLSNLIEAEGLKEKALKGRGGSRAAPGGIKVTLIASASAPKAVEAKREGLEVEAKILPNKKTSSEAATPSLSSVNAASIAAAAASRSFMMRPPVTSTDFESSWRSFADDSSLQCSYLNLLVPDQLPSVFKSTLTPQILASLLKSLLSGVVSQSVTINHAIKIIESLVCIPRFEMTAMSLGSKERAAIKELWEKTMVIEGGSVLADDSLRKKFRI